MFTNAIRSQRLRVALKKKHYSKLNSNDWQWLNYEGIVNGYGPNSQPILKWLLARICPAFKRSNSDIHDFTYWQGVYPFYSKEYLDELKIENPALLIEIEDCQRLQCDRGFFLRLCEDSVDTGWWMLYYVPLSLIYYGAVRALGKPYFQYQ